ncbi:hypothetical protein [Flavobacterium sp. RS13.1]|uniref:hypothetical protein n=1 Tax=Flavobacterium sp. RS13.1 TaxID=3400345 RepID=UPI003AAD429C
MKKITKCFFTLVLITGFVLTSCSSDSDENTNGETKTEDYWPTAVNNNWVLSQNGEEQNIKIISSANNNGTTYYKFGTFFGATDAISGSATVWIKKVNGEYFLKIDDINYETEGVKSKITGYEYVFFKDNIEVNKTWSGSYTQKATFVYPGVSIPEIKTVSSYTGTILEKGATATIKGVTYKDVIKFKLHQESKIEGEKSTSVDSEYWLAKNVGVIRAKSGNVISELVSYNLK